MEEWRGNMKKFALSGAVLSVAMAIGAAQAEPLTLSSDQMDQVTAGANIYSTLSFRKNVDVRERLTIDKAVFAFAFVDGHIANANGTAQAFGRNTLAEALTVTYTAPGVSQAASESNSATYPGLNFRHK